MSEPAHKISQAMGVTFGQALVGAGVMGHAIRAAMEAEQQAVREAATRSEPVEWVYFFVRPWWRSLRRDPAYRRHLLFYRLVRKQAGAEWRTETELMSRHWSYRRAIGTLRTLRLLIMADHRSASPVPTQETNP